MAETIGVAARAERNLLAKMTSPDTLDDSPLRMVNSTVQRAPFTPQMASARLDTVLALDLPTLTPSRLAVAFNSSRLTSFRLAITRLRFMFLSFYLLTCFCLVVAWHIAFD